MGKMFEKLKLIWKSLLARRYVSDLKQEIPIYFDYNKFDKSRFKVNKLESQYYPRRAPDNQSVIIKLQDNYNLKIGWLVARTGCYFSARGPMEIGNNCFFNDNCTVLSRAGVYIGDYFMASNNVYIRDNDGHKIIKDGKELRPKKIVIGNRVWLGNNVTVMKGVTIGNNVIIGANSTVTKDIPSNSIAAGNPAKVIYTSKDLYWEK